MHCLASLEDWKAAHHQHLTDWLNVLADTEAMNSLAGHAFANPEYVVPAVSDASEVTIAATSLGHPLIPAAKRISNDFAMQGTGKTILVTGSNMSGKSTFLRTIGLNLVLAQMGAVVSAGAFACSPVRVFSSMRTQDSLEESTSSFYAELKRLRKLLELADEQAHAPVFYLLDEILKGTNSADRHRGAEALIRQLHAKTASGMVSTHDLELGEWGATETYTQLSLPLGCGEWPATFRLSVARGHLPEFQCVGADADDGHCRRTRQNPTCTLIPGICTVV
jgi:DNA mismatch repair ATPase MutS